MSKEKLSRQDAQERQCFQSPDSGIADRDTMKKTGIQSTDYRIADKDAKNFSCIPSSDIRLADRDASKEASTELNVPSAAKNSSQDVALKMSKRLITVADMLGEVKGERSSKSACSTEDPLCSYRCVADVGCDHGYVSIYLVQKKMAASCLAMDVRKGPLGMAEKNIEEYRLSDKIKVRLSDGLSGLAPGEADALVIAGMGGKLMISILDKMDLSLLGIKTMVLQPQSDLEEFRRYILDAGFAVEDERIICDEGKYYFPMRVSVYPSDTSGNDALSLLSDRIPKDRALCLHFRYGASNILRQDRTFISYLLHGREVTTSILKTLNPNSHPDRYLQLKEELEDINYLLSGFENGL
ncbi:MAG: class I SAM-dependent methyltransferase [Butyrivibrio sp.]|nr:class I SAM-dependent methyltransferase [Butyrivibrio sp.]